VSSVNIKSKKETNTGWVFSVEIADANGTSDFRVTVDKMHWKKLTNEAIIPDEFVRQSFEFLLKRESKESILQEFNLKQISMYFPEYEKEIKIGLLAG